MKKSTYLIILLAAVLGGGLGLYLQQRAQEEVPPSPPVATTPIASEVIAPAAAEPAIRHLIPDLPPETSASAPSQPLGLEAVLNTQLGTDLVKQLFFPDILIQRIVATVDNLPRPEAPVSMFPLRSPAGGFRVIKQADQLSIAPENAARYHAHIALLEKIPPATAARIYIRLYADFQQAYASLGYPKAYFNDRLIECLDNLLATPEAPAQSSLVQPKVLYRFAAPDLEAASAGQKILMRMGPDNRQHVKQWLSEFRPLILRRPQG